MLKEKQLMSAEKLEGNDELLIEILLLLPPKLIFKCKCVSKRWNGIIVHHLFLQSYCSRTSKQQLSGDGGRLIAFFQVRSMFCREPVPDSRAFVNILPVVQQDELKIKSLPDRFGNVIHSSNGLFLCDDYRLYRNRMYHVVNPLTRKWIQLPPPLAPHGLRGIGLACTKNMEELVPSFKVLGLVHNLFRVAGRSFDIETYSYDTRIWTPSTLIANEELPNSLFLILVCKGVFHWYTMKNSIAVYNSNRDENCLHLIKLPEDQSRNNHLAATRSSTDDLLWIGTGDDHWGGGGVLNFWKLPVDDYDSYKCATIIPEDRWVLMHTIDTTSLYNEMSLALKSKQIKIEETNIGSNRAIKLEALIHSNHVAAVLNLQQMMFLYDPESQRLDVVQYRGRPYAETCIAGWAPLIETLCLSSYGPFGSSYE